MSKKQELLQRAKALLAKRYADIEEKKKQAQQQSDVRTVKDALNKFSEDNNAKVVYVDGLKNEVKIKNPVKEVDVKNFPKSFSVDNFPKSFRIENPEVTVKNPTDNIGIIVAIKEAVRIILEFLSLSKTKPQVVMSTKEDKETPQNVYILDPKTGLPVSLDEIQANNYQSFLVGGSSSKVAVKDQLTHYKISDIDESSATKYYGFLRKDGGWYILRESSNTFRYAYGEDNYDWSSRASLTYSTFDVAF